jgi:addiction module HigA family antidote
LAEQLRAKATRNLERSGKVVAPSATPARRGSDGKGQLGMTGMHNPPHPGLLLEDYLGEVSLAEAARRLGVTRATLSRIKNGHASITADMAVRLGQLLGTSAELWLGMQTAYDLWTERQKARPPVVALTRENSN